MALATVIEIKDIVTHQDLTGLQHPFKCQQTSILVATETEQMQIPTE